MTVRSSIITAEVLWTDYEATVTRSGKEALLVSYHTRFETVKQWLYPGSPSMLAWWSDRCKSAVPGLQEAVEMATKGKLLPTKQVKFRRENRWPVVVVTVVGSYPPKVKEWMQEVRATLGDVEVVRVRF